MSDADPHARPGSDVGDGDGADGAPPEHAVAAVDTVLADRYRLVERVGVAQDGLVEFWRARDSVLARDIGVTLLARSNDLVRSQWAGAVVTGLLRWGQFSYPGCARILDVIGVGFGTDRRGLPERISVASVTDWAPGPTLSAFLSDTESDTGMRRGAVDAETALGMVAPIAAAAEAAHGQGLLLGCDRPGLLHIAQAGTRSAHVHLGFPLPDPDAEAEDDVRGLGAVLYALLTGRWPLADTREAAPAEPRDDERPGPDGDAPCAPGVLDPAIPEVVSDLALNALGTSDAVAPLRTAAALHRTISDLLAAEHHAQQRRDDALLALPGFDTEDEPEAVWRSTALPAETSSPRPARPRGRVLAAVGVAVVLLASAGVLGLRLGDRSHPAPAHASAQAAPVPAPFQAESAPPLAPRAPGAAATPAGVATVVSAAVYDPTGQPDNPSQVWRALGTDPHAGWSTDTYLQPFPALKPGVGIMIGFAGPVQLTSLTITSPSTGSELQVRAASDASTGFADTTPLAAATLQAGDTSVPLTGSQPVTHVLVWITKLGGGGDDNVTEISNLRFHDATD